MMINRSFDYDLIRKIITNPKIYPMSSDDKSPPPNQYKPPENEQIYYLIPEENGQPLGVFVVVPLNAACFEVHTCLLPESWGDMAKQAAAHLLDWVFSRTDCQKLITNVPAYNRLALRFAKAAGLVEFGVNSKSYLKNGLLHDQVMLGIERGTLCQ